MARISTTMRSPACRMTRGPRLQALRYGEKRRAEQTVEHALFATLGAVLTTGLAYLMRDDLSALLAHAAPIARLIGHS